MVTDMQTLSNRSKSATTERVSEAVSRALRGANFWRRRLVSSWKGFA